MIGDDDMVSGLTGFGNEKPADDDQEALEEEKQQLDRLKPVLEILNNIIDDRIYEVSNITHLISVKDPKEAKPEEVMTELRARELHLEFLEQFRSKIRNTQNTIDEIKNG